MSKTGDIVTIKMTDDPNNSDFEYMAHRRGDTQKDMFYIGAYLGYVADNKLRSLSGKTPAGNRSFNSSVSVTRNNNSGLNSNDGTYDLIGWYQYLFIQCMYVLKYKNLNSQDTIGIGRWSGSLLNTGETNTKGMNWGDSTDSTVQLKLFGIEDFWGNWTIWLNGINVAIASNVGNSSHVHDIYTTLDDTRVYTQSNVNIIDPGSTKTNFIRRVVGNTHLGFIPIELIGSSQTTYYCDYGWYWNTGTSGNTAYLGYIGNSAGWDVSGNGIFAFTSLGENTGSGGGNASRLMYL